MDGEATLILGADWAPIRRFGEVIAADPIRVYGDLTDVLADADFRVFNLESPLAGGRFIAKSGAAFTGDPAAVAALDAVHCDAVTLANNHVFDCGSAGFAATRRLLNDHGIAAFGAGNDADEARNVLTVTLHGLRVAMYAISEGEDLLHATATTPGVRGWEVERLADELRRDRDKYDFRIVIAHCGLEYQPFPSFYVYEAFRLWAEAGADLIVGHHPHVVQGMTRFGRVPAFFSLGNFVFYQETKLLHRKRGMLLKVRLSRAHGVTAEPIPYRIDADRVRKPTSEEAERFAVDFAELSAPLGDPDHARAAWHAVLAHYGAAGLSGELEKIAGTLQTDSVKGAAMLRNRLFCMQHRTQWRDALERILAGTIDDADPRLLAMVRRYFTEEL